MLRQGPRPRSLRAAAVLVAAALLAPAASAGPLTGGSLTFSTGGASPLVFPADATLAGSAIGPQQVTIQAGVAFSGQLTAPLQPSHGSIAITITGNSGGVWSGSPLSGSSVRILGLASVRPLGESALAFPISAGAGDTLVFGGAGFFVAVRRYPWTTGTLEITGLGTGQDATATTMGDVATGTPGLVSLVSASRITSSFSDPMLQIQRLELEADVVPEPQRLLLLLTGASMLVGAGAARAARARAR